VKRERNANGSGSKEEIKKTRTSWCARAFHVRRLFVRNHRKGKKKKKKKGKERNQGGSHRFQMPEWNSALLMQRLSAPAKPGSDASSLSALSDQRN